MAVGGFLLLGMGGAGDHRRRQFRRRQMDPEMVAARKHCRPCPWQPRAGTKRPARGLSKEHRPRWIAGRSRGSEGVEASGRRDNKSRPIPESLGAAESLNCTLLEEYQRSPSGWLGETTWGGAGFSRSIFSRYWAGGSLKLPALSLAARWKYQMPLCRYRKVPGGAPSMKVRDIGVRLGLGALVEQVVIARDARGVGGGVPNQKRRGVGAPVVARMGGELMTGYPRSCPTGWRRWRCPRAAHCPSYPRPERSSNGRCFPSKLRPVQVMSSLTSPSMEIFSFFPPSVQR